MGLEFLYVYFKADFAEEETALDAVDVGNLPVFVTVFIVDECKIVVKGNFDERLSTLAPHM